MAPAPPRTFRADGGRLRSGPAVVLALLLAAPLAGQHRSTAFDDAQWLDRFVPALAGPQVPPRLPVLDDAGRPITLEEIQARIDPSGGAGAFWGGLLGWAIATPVLHFFMANSQDCNEEQGSVYVACSPREDAMRSAVTWGGGALVATLTGWFGWAADKTDWHEAVRQIREDRRRVIR